MAGIREHLADTLLRFGTEAAMDRAAMLRALAAAHGRRGQQEAVSALAVAAWVDSAALWLSWRLRPRQISL